MVQMMFTLEELEEILVLTMVLIFGLLLIILEKVQLAMLLTF